MEIRDRYGAVPFRQGRPVRAENQGEMDIGWYLPTKGLDQKHLFGRIGEVVFTADHMCDLHLVIVDDAGPVIGREPIRFNQDHVLKNLRIEGDLPAEPVFEPDLPLRHAEEDGTAAVLHLFIGQSPGDEPFGLFQVNRNPFALAKQLPLPGKAEPGERIEDFFFKLCFRTFAVGVFDPQEEAALLVPGVEVVEEGGAGTAYVKETRG